MHIRPTGSGKNSPQAHQFASHSSKAPNPQSCKGQRSSNLTASVKPPLPLQTDLANSRMLEDEVSGVMASSRARQCLVEQFLANFALETSVWLASLKHASPGSNMQGLLLVCSGWRLAA